MSGHPRHEPADFLDSEGPGSDPGVAYERAGKEGHVPDDAEGELELEPSPGIEDVYRSGS